MPNPLIKILLSALKEHIKPYLKCPIMGRVAVENVVIERRMVDLLPKGIYKVTVVATSLGKNGQNDLLNVSTTLELYEE